MKKRNLKTNINSISEILGTVLLLAISISLFSILYLMIQTVVDVDESPSAELFGYVEENQVIIEHQGGESLTTGTIVEIIINGTSKTIDINDPYLMDYNDNDIWDIGEKIKYSTVVEGLKVEALVKNTNANKILFFGILQKGNSIIGNSNTYDPIISNPNPLNGSNNIQILPMLSIDIEDGNGNLMDISWYSNVSGSWILFGSNLSCINGTYSQINDDFNDEETTYWWRINLSDGTGRFDEKTYKFTTLSTNSINTFIDNINPYEASLNPLTISASSIGLNPDNISLYYRWSNDNWSSGWEVLTYDDFENGFGNYTDGGSDCSLYSGGSYAHQGSYAANIQDDSGISSSFYHTDGIDIDSPNFVSLKVDFWFYANFVVPGIDFWVQFFDGSDWITVADFDEGDDFSNGQFYHKIIFINESDYSFPSDMKIRFMCDGRNNNDDIYIDDIYINATEGKAIDWTLWNDATNPDLVQPWEWGFNFPEDVGYYEFYSIGQKTGNEIEDSPDRADAKSNYE